MKTLLNGYKRLSVTIRVIGVLSSIHIGDTLAHTPHDVITALEISPFITVMRL